MNTRRYSTSMLGRNSSLLASGKLFTALCLVLPLTLCAHAKSKAPSAAQGPAFIENRGQWDSSVYFLSQTPGMNMWLTADGMVFDYHRDHFAPAVKGKPVQGTREGDVVRVSFENAQPVSVAGSELRPGTQNYFRGNDSRRWVRGAQRYKEAMSTELYSGVSARYYFDNGAPRYDLQLKPGADPSKVAMKIEGAQSVRTLANGNLEIKTPIGSIEQAGLVAYQQIGSHRVQVPCKMRAENGVVRFKTGDYDSSKPLTIDPLIYSTYLGGAGDTTGNNSGDTAAAVATDTNGNAYVTGFTESADFPITAGAYQTAMGSYQVAFITKFSSTGGLVFSTYLSGTGNGTEGQGIAVDSSSNVYVTGWTFSQNFPYTPGTSYQTTSPGIEQAWAVKLSPTGTTLLDSSDLGGGGENYGNGITVDASGNVYVVGWIDNPDMPTTAGAFQPTYPSTFNSGFIYKLTPTWGLSFCSYIGGSGSDIAMAVAVNSAGYPIVAVQSGSTDMPVSTNAYQKVMAAGAGGFNVYVAKINTTGTAILAATYVGGTNQDFVTGLALDSSDNMWVGGYTISTDYPTTAGAFQNSTANADQTLAFVSRISADCSQLLASSCLKGSVYDRANGVALDSAGNPVLAGEAGSADFPTTAGAFQTTAMGGQNAFLAKLSSDCKTLVYSTFIEGSYDEQALAISMDKNNEAVIVGTTNSTDFPLLNAYQSTFKGTGGGSFASPNGFVLKFSLPVVNQQLTMSLNPSTVQTGGTSVMTVNINPAAPTGGATIALSSNGSSIGSFTIGAGLTQGSVNITTNGTPAGVYALTASYSGASQTQDLTVTSGPSLSLVKTIPAASVTGGGATTGEVVLTSAAPTGGLVVSVSSSNTAAAKTSVSSVTVPAGQNYATFGITTSPVNASTAVTITATYSGTSKTCTLTVNPAVPNQVKFSPTTIPGGASDTCEIVLNGKAGSNGTVVDLEGSTSGLGTFQTSVTVPAGLNYATFKITTYAVNTTSSVTVLASANGSSAQATLSITPPTFNYFVVDPVSVTGGVSATGKAYVNENTASNGITVTLSSSSTAAKVPASVLIAAGTAEKSFTVTTSPVDTATAVTITGKAGSVTKTMTLTVNPPVLSSLKMLSTSTQGGKVVYAEAILNGKAGPSGVNVAVSSSNTAAAKVTSPAKVAAGSNYVVFPITTLKVTSNTTVTISATFGGHTYTGTLTVTP